MSKNDNISISLRMNAELLKRLKKAANANWRTFSAEIGWRLEQSFSDYVVDNAPKDAAE